MIFRKPTGDELRDYADRLIEDAGLDVNATPRFDKLNDIERAIQARTGVSKDRARTALAKACRQRRAGDRQ